MMRSEEARARLALIASMCIFGTIGLLRRYLPVPSGFLAMARGLLGALSLFLFVRLRGKRLSRDAIRANLFRLVLSGALIGFNWILLFEAYRYTTVAVAELCYNMAPVFVLIAAPFLLHERLTPRKLLCVAVALFGMALVSDLAHAGFSGASEWRGVGFALSAAALYAAVVLLNKQIHNIGAYDKTIVQIGAAGLVLIPYVLLAEDLSAVRFTPSVVALLLVASLVQTGFAYALYFGSVEALSAHTLSILGYLETVVAIFFSVLLLREPMTGLQALGAALILCAAVAAELPEKKPTT